MIKKYSVLLCLVASVVFIVIASLNYPGGSLFNKNSAGFQWSKNFMSNLFATKAINGTDNPGWVWALIGMAFHSVGYGLFFFNMSKKITSSRWSVIFKYIGAANILLIFLIATPLHDVGTISILLTLIGLFIITFFVLKSKLHVLKFCCVFCLLTYYVFFTFYGLGNVGWAAILQKVYIVSSMLLVTGLEYFTNHEDFVFNKPGI